MPDADKQAIIEELDRRGEFKDAHKREIIQELARRGEIRLPKSLSSFATDQKHSASASDRSHPDSLQMQGHVSSSSRGITIPPEAQPGRIQTPSAKKRDSSNSTQKPSSKSIDNSTEKNPQPEAQRARQLVQERIAYHEDEASRLRSERNAANARMSTAARKFSNLDVVGAAQSIRPEDLNPLTHMREVTAPIQQAIGVLGNRLMRRDPLQSHSPLQREIEKQTAKLPLRQQMQAQDPRGLLQNLSPDASRQLDMPSGGAQGFAKGATKGTMELATVDNALIAMGLAGHLPIISKAAQGYFGAEAAKGTWEGVHKFIESGGKDTDALGRGAAAGLAAAGIAWHMAGGKKGAKKIGGAIADTVRKDATVKVEPRADNKDLLHVDAEKKTYKPNPKPKEDAAAKRERERGRVAPRERATKPVETPKPEPVAKKPQAKAKPVVVKPKAEVVAPEKPVVETKPAKPPRTPKKPDAPATAPEPKAEHKAPEGQKGTYYHVSENPQHEGLKSQPFGVEKDPVVWLSHDGPVVRNGHVYAVDASKAPGLIRKSANGFPVHLGDIPKEAITYLGERSAHEPFKIPKETKPAVSPTDFADWVSKQPKDKATYHSAQALFDAYKKEHPEVTREQFGQMLHDLPREQFEPTSTSSDKGFTAKDSTGAERKFGGVRAKASRDTGGPQELHSGVNPFELLRRLKNSQLGQAVGDFVYGQKSALTHESTEGVRSVNRHENARTSANLQADEALPPVTAHLGAEDRAKFGAYGVADRLLAEKNRNNQIINAGPARRKVLLKAVRAAEAARDAAILTRDPGAIGKATRALNEARATSQGHLKVIAEAKKAIRENALDRVGHPFSVTMPDGSTHVIKAADIGPFFARPEIAEAVRLHKAGGERILHENQTRQGNLAGVSVGEHTKSYFPAKALDATGLPRRASSSKGGAHTATATMAKNVNAEEFRANAHSYDTDYHSYMRDAMQNSLSRATEREMNNTLLKEGVMIPYDTSNPDIRTAQIPDPNDPSKTITEFQMKYKGTWEPAKDYSIQKGESRDARLPDRVIMPLRIYNEVAPLFDPTTQTTTDRMANNAFSRLMRTYLMAPADAMQHTAALSSRSAYGASRAVSPTDKPIVTGIKQAGRGAVAPFQSAVNFVRFWNPNLYTPELRARAHASMAEAGVLPSDFGDIGNKPDTPPVVQKTASGTRTIAGESGTPKNMLDKKNWTAERAKHPGHNVLYGDRGVLSNAGTAVYKIFEDQGALKTPEGRAMLHDALRETFNTYSKTDKPGLQKVAQSLGAGSFYETGLKNRTAALSAGKHVYLASLASRALIITGAVYAATGKKPWEIPGYKWGYVPLYKDPKTGEVLFMDARVFDRVGFYPDQVMHAMAQNAYDVGQKKISMRAGIIGGATDIANWASAPVVSGPVPGVLSNVTGKLPYAYPDRTLSGIEIADNPAKKLGVTPKRALSLVESALPITSVLTFDPAHDAQASTPKSESAEKINRVLRVMGLPQLRLATDEKVVEKRRAAAERGAERADSKAMGTYTPPANKGRSLIRLPALPGVRLPR